jgi:hypothetical protein
MIPDDAKTATAKGPKPAGTPRKRIDEHIVEIVSDSGEGAQKAGQVFGTVCAKMGNGVWTVEIIPAEIKPPARSPAGASGIRVRLGSNYVTNMGDEADLVVAFNEQVLYGRIAEGAFGKSTVILLENKWAEDPLDEIRAHGQGIPGQRVHRPRDPHRAGLHGGHVEPEAGQEHVRARHALPDLRSGSEPGV